MTAHRVSVLHVAHNALPHVGGLETVLAAETQFLARRGLEVGLVTSTAPDAGAGSTTELGVHVTRVGAWHGLELRFGVPFPVFTPRLLATLRHAVRRAGLVHMHDPLYLTSWVAALWCRLLRTPYVVHRHVGFVYHSSPIVRLVQGAVLATAGRWVLRGARAVIAIDDAVASGLDERLPVHVLGNAVDTARFRPADPEERDALRDRYGLPAATPLVLFVGRLVPKKGFDEVVAARHDDYTVVVVGGDRPEDFTDDRVVFLGSLPPDEVAEVYRAVDLVVVASVGECPLTVIEALASGVPLLAHDDPALRSSPWTQGPGVVFVDTRDGKLDLYLRDRLRDLAALRAEGKDARAFVENSFSWDAHLDRLQEIYASIR